MDGDDLMETNLNNSVKASWDVMINHLQEDTSRLLESEKALLRAEMNEKIAEAKVAVSSFIIAGSFLIVGIFSLVATTIIVLNQYMPLPRASGIVTASLFAAGYIVFKVAQRKMSSVNIKPQKTIETFREIKTSLKEKINGYKH
jgi:hypothetical protein